MPPNDVPLQPLCIALCALALTSCGGGGEEPLSLDAPSLVARSGMRANAGGYNNAAFAATAASAADPSASDSLMTQDAPDGLDMMRSRYEAMGAYEADAPPASFAAQSGATDFDSPSTASEADAGT